MKIADKKITDRICELLPSLQKLIDNEETDYQMTFVSVFDHWLTQDEFDPEIHTEDPATLQRRRTNLNNFVKEIYASTPTFQIPKVGNNNIQLHSFESSEEIEKYCNIKVQHGESGQRYDIIIPEYQAVYSEEWDWTNIIWFRDKGKINRMMNLAKNCGLHILNKRKN